MQIRHTSRTTQRLEWRRLRPEQRSQNCLGVASGEAAEDAEAGVARMAAGCAGSSAVRSGVSNGCTVTSAMHAFRGSLFDGSVRGLRLWRTLRDAPRNDGTQRGGEVEGSGVLVAVGWTERNHVRVPRSNLDV